MKVAEEETYVVPLVRSITRPCDRLAVLDEHAADGYLAILESLLGLVSALFSAVSELLDWTPPRELRIVLAVTSGASFGRLTAVAESGNQPGRQMPAMNTSGGAQTSRLLVPPVPSSFVCFRALPTL